MDCPHCQASTHVLESRRADEGDAVRRRRECKECGERFTTFERRKLEPVWVIKRGGKRERFDAAKLAGGLARAAHKRPVDPAAIRALAAGIEDVGRSEGGELRAERIGELSLEGLAELDRIAYLQFAAVYKGFEDPGEFTAELRRLGVKPPRNLGVSGDAGSVRSEEQS